MQARGCSEAAARIFPGFAASGPTLGYIYAALAIVIWVGFILVSRAAGSSDLDGLDLVALRFGTASVVLLPFLLRQGRLARILTWRMCVLAVTGGIGYAALAYLAFERAPAAHAAILMPGILPFASAVLARVLLGERLTRSGLAGLALNALGIAMLCVEGLGDWSGLHWQGDLLFICAAASWAVFTVLARRWGVGVGDALVGVTLISALAYLPLYFSVLPVQPGAASIGAIVWQAFYQGVLATIVSFVLYLKAMELIGVSRVNTLMALVPPLAGVSAVPVLGEMLSGTLLVGLVLVSLGAFCGEIRPLAAREAP